MANSSATLASLPIKIAGPSRHPIVGLVDDRSQCRAAIPRLLSLHGISAIPFAGVNDLPQLLDNAVLLVADIDYSISEVLKRTTFGTRIVAYAEDVELPRVVEAIRQGASNYVRWPEKSPALVGAVRDCLRDICSNSDGRTATNDPRQMLPTLITGHRNRRIKSPRLTRRENEILKLVSGGSSSGAIGELLQLSMRTVECHRSNIIRKLGVANMTEAVRFALRLGLIL